MYCLQNQPKHQTIKHRNDSSHLNPLSIQSFHKKNGITQNTFYITYPFTIKFHKLNFKDCWLLNSCSTKYNHNLFLKLLISSNSRIISCVSIINALFYEYVLNSMFSQSLFLIFRTFGVMSISLFEDPMICISVRVQDWFLFVSSHKI